MENTVAEQVVKKGANMKTIKISKLERIEKTKKLYEQIDETEKKLRLLKEEFSKQAKHLTKEEFLSIIL